MNKYVLYFLIGGFLLIIINKNRKKTNLGKDSNSNSNSNSNVSSKELLDFYIPKTTSKSIKLSKNSNKSILSNNKTKDKNKKLIYPRHVKFNNEPIIYEPKYDDVFISSNQGNTELYPVDSSLNISKSWTEKNVSEHPKYYRAEIEDEVTNVGAFFDKNNQFFDSTSNRAKNNLPDRCFLNENNDVECEFNNRLYNVPPKIINNINKNIIYNDVGVNMSQNKLYKNKSTNQIETINGNNYNVWNYDNEDEFFDNVTGNSGNNDYSNIININTNNIAI
tara:strand:+ start:484 stop:1314 length:831 start_codon:yes stop_codon:yes gene_type:complete